MPALTWWAVSSGTCSCTDRNDDMDIVIEGDGIRLCQGTMASSKQGPVHTHARFGTAVITLPDGLKIDVASARMEYYKFPAAMPIVEMSSIKLDLYRRDFTSTPCPSSSIRTGSAYSIDFFNAQNDLKEKRIRVLHNLSFVEDPTRVFRAIRFEQRFSFAISRLTAGLIHNAVSMDFFRELSAAECSANCGKSLRRKLRRPPSPD